jgi:hypothetical protein
MQDVQAFVGHSFRPEDRALIQVFIDHFRTLAHSYPGFSWDHAEKAEAVPLAQKVLEKIDGKNVFIGICTRTEQAVDPNALQQLWLSNRLHAKRSDFVWKTSDWLIQEIGLAVGRNMRIILFLEEGVRPPGGLYGNMEFIPFLRDRPRDSFDKSRTTS